jgi:hypothetical protein
VERTVTIHAHFSLFDLGLFFLNEFKDLLGVCEGAQNLDQLSCGIRHFTFTCSNILCHSCFNHTLSLGHGFLNAACLLDHNNLDIIS